MKHKLAPLAMVVCQIQYSPQAYITVSHQLLWATLLGISFNSLLE